MDRKELISKAMSEIAKMSHKKSPRSKEYYRAIQKKSVAKRRANKKLKLSPNNA